MSFDSRGRSRLARRSAFRLLAIAVGTAMLLVPARLSAQRVLQQPERVVTLARGTSALLTVPQRLQRVSIADPEIAEAVVVSPLEVLINAKKVGNTSLIVWDQNETPRLYGVDVSADASVLQRQIRSLYPNADVNVTASGNTVILSGAVTDPLVVRRAVEMASASGATVINNISAPSAQQILLHVRFAEVTRSVATMLGTDIQLLNAQRLGPINDNNTDNEIQTISEGIVRLMLIQPDANLDVLIRAMRSRGDYRSLAEPNLIALEGQEATFLAGGEFPFPIVQGGQSNAITIMWKEFGVRLRFTPTVLNNGSVRLHVAPEVSSLDFGNGLTLNGFAIPTVNTRRAETEVELRPGQNLAIAGLLDNSIVKNVDKIPFLGDIPILGNLFRSVDHRQGRTELLVVVTPYLVTPTQSPIPLPTGEPRTWDWSGPLKRMPAYPSHPHGGEQ